MGCGFAQRFLNIRVLGVSQVMELGTVQGTVCVCQVV